MSQKFWIYDPLVLVKNFSIIPYSDDTVEERLNKVTRIVVITSLLLWWFSYNGWFKFLILSIIIIIVMHFLESR